MNLRDAPIVPRRAVEDGTTVRPQNPGVVLIVLIGAVGTDVPPRLTEAATPHGETANEVMPPRGAKTTATNVAMIDEALGGTSVKKAAVVHVAAIKGVMVTGAARAIAADRMISGTDLRREKTTDRARGTTEMTIVEPLTTAPPLMNDGTATAMTSVKVAAISAIGSPIEGHVLAAAG
ncbi:hypothetical protein [Austwickia sp. TVS 96-490-7B]|uniref:hypothetical protein n=1 Tax=Austwickia sp. TVS 96-490-7B TaxID=2830843 RepID=UPI001C55F6EC|nr:hypothetical protein [Austwickia sp. TVS 96-490-7B]